jgi:WD40 repeat protein
LLCRFASRKLEPRHGTIPDPPTVDASVRRFCCSYLVCAALILTVPIWAQAPKEKQPAPPAAGPKDAFGDPLPPGALARIGTLRYRVAENYRFQPQMSPDGKLLAAPDNANQIELWELPAWTQRKSISVPNSSLRSVAFTPDSKQIVALDLRQQFHLFDLATGKSILASPPMAKKQGGAEQSRLVVSRDQKTVIRQDTLFGNAKHRIIVWDLAKNVVNDPLTITAGPRGAPVAISGDGRRAALVTRKTDPQQNKNGEPDQKKKVENGIDIWDLTTGKLDTNFKTDNMISQLAFAPDGRTLAASGAKGPVRIYEAATGKAVQVSAAGTSSVSHVEFAPDGKTLFVADQTGITRIDPATGKTTSTFQSPIPVGPSQFAFLPDGKVLALAKSDRALHFWEATTGQLFSPKGEGVPAATISDVRFGPDKSLFVACENGSASWWDPRAAVKLRDLRLDAKEMLASDGYVPVQYAFSLSPSTEFVVGRGQGTGQVELFDAQSGKKLFRHEFGDYDLVVCFFDADRKVAIDNGNAVHIRDPRSGKELSRVEFPLQQKERLMQFAVSPSGQRIVAFSVDENFELDRRFLWDVAAKKITREWRVQHDQWAIQFSADSRWLGLADANGNALLVDVGRGGRDHRLVVPGGRGGGAVTELAFARDGRQVACAVRIPYAGRESSRIYVFEMASKKIRLELPGHATGTVRRLTYSPDGRLLASGATDTTTLFWQAGLRAFAETPAAKDAQPDELNDWFAKLAGPDAKTAFQAMIKLAQSPAQAVKLFESKIEPARKPDLGGLTIPQLIQDLGSDAFTVRTKADQTMRKLGAAAEANLRKALQGTSLETRRRIAVLLDRIVNHEWTGDELRHARAVEVLQAIGSPEARALLTRWAGGDPAAILSVEAREALAMP